MLKKIISGGQTGADQGGLEGGKIAGLETGGTAPANYWTEDGESRSLLESYELGTTLSSSYPPRTKINVRNSDGTLIFGDYSSRGSALTIRYCEDLDRPYYAVSWRKSKIADVTVENVAKWIADHEIEVLNVAGNRESKNPGIYDATRDFVVRLVEELRKERDDV